MIDISDIKQNFIAYGGLSCLKVGITMEDKNYLVKFPGNLRARELTNTTNSYSNGPYCEYIGSHIFNLFDMKVHNTQLATRNNKTVVMCEDFVQEGMRLFEFRELKATFEPAFINVSEEFTDGTGSDIDEALLVIREHPTFKYIVGAETFFWKMFILDALIGNPDRNNGNWGIILSKGQVSLAPVYDNGNCLNDKWDENKMQKFLSDQRLFINEAWKGKVCFFTRNDKRVNPFQLIESNSYPLCTKSLLELNFHGVNQEIKEIIASCEGLTETQRRFYNEILEERLRHLTLLQSKLKCTRQMCIFKED